MGGFMYCGRGLFHFSRLTAHADLFQFCVNTRTIYRWWILS